MEIVYETLSVPNRAAELTAKRRRVAILWIDDSLLGRQWLSAVTGLLTELSPPRDDVRLRILGPSDSEGLVAALNELTNLDERLRAPDKRVAPDPRNNVPPPAKGSVEAEGLARNWNTLARLSVISANSTAPDEQLLKAARRSDPLRVRPAACPSDGQPAAQAIGEVFRQRLHEVHDGLKGIVGQELATPEPPFFLRTIATDDQLVDRLVDELFGRGLATSAGRVALIGEWDSIYARTFGETLQARLLCKGRAAKVEVDLLSYQYLRGLDGVTVEGAPKPGQRDGDSSLRVNDSAKAGDSTRSGDRNAPPVEWPEGRDQRDYLRRLVDQRMGQNDWRHPDSEIQAIGIIGGDVHDKLMIVQALRGAFQDRTVFTTDLDARLLHPVVNQYTRNLIVASSLPLALDDKLQCGVPPFRDSYQTAMFLAGRYAGAPDRSDDQEGNSGHGCAKLNTSEMEGTIHAAISNPFLFEIARDGVVELLAADGNPRTTAAHREPEARWMYGLLAGGVLLMLGVVMVLGAPGPAMKAARESWSSTATAAAARASVVVASIEAAALEFAAGVVIELAFPGSVGPAGAIVLAVAAAAFFWAFLFPGTRWVREFRAGRGLRERRWERFALQSVVFAVAVTALWVGGRSLQGGGADLHEPFAAINGASAWPSQLLRTLVIVLFAWFLDYAWCRTASEADAIEKDYFGSRGEARAQAAPSRRMAEWRRRAFAACRDATIWLWQPKAADPGKDGSIDGAGLWREYRKGLHGWPRLGRVAMWMAIAIGLLFLVGALIGGARPEIPARGIADRALFQITVIVSGLAVVLLLVLVADATVLTWRFIVLLKGGRTRYPTKTVLNFAAELGTAELQALAAERVAASPAKRGAGSGHNTLLDDWIDARMLAEHTAVIGPLIIFPFILVAFMIVARNHLFDNWQMGASILVMFAGFVLWSLAMAALLNYGAETARRLALERMQADLLWLKGAGPRYAKLADQFGGLIDQVRTMRKGAFAPFFEQPLIKAVLVPLGGAGGIQLLDRLVFGF